MTDQGRATNQGYEGIWLTPSLLPDGHERALRALRDYYAPLTGKDHGFTGGAWDSFDPSSSRAVSANTFTSDDVTACALLSAPIHGRAAIELLDRQRRRFEVLLEDVGPDRDFVDVDVRSAEFEPVQRLYRALVELPGIGETRATKLMARKRPRLVPIVDAVVRQEIFNDGPRHWIPLHDAFVARDRCLWQRVAEIRAQAGLGAEVSVLRVFDVLTWMDGSHNRHGSSVETTAEAQRESSALAAPTSAAEEMDRVETASGAAFDEG